MNLSLVDPRNKSSGATFPIRSTACGHRMAHRKWKETKQLPSMLPGPAVPGSCLVSFHFLLAILCPQAVNKVRFCLASNFPLIPMQNLSPPVLTFSMSHVTGFIWFMAASGLVGIPIAFSGNVRAMQICHNGHHTCEGYRQSWKI